MAKKPQEKLGSRAPSGRRSKWRDFRGTLRPTGAVLTGVAVAQIACAIVGGLTEWWTLPAADRAPEDVLGLVVGAIATAAVGLGLFSYGKRFSSPNLSRREAILAVVLIWLIAGMAGAVPFAVSAPMGFVDAFFESVSGMTTTGATVITDIEGTLSMPLLLWRSLIQWLGGMGIVVLFVAIFPSLGAGAKHMFKGEVPGTSAEGLKPRIAETSFTLWKLYAGFTAVEFVILAALGMSPFEAACHSLTTMSTGGFSTRDASVSAFDSFPIEMVIATFMFLGSVNYGLYYALLRGRSLRAVFRNTELRAFFVLCAIFVLTLTVGTLEVHGWDFIQSFRYSYFMVGTSMSSTGYGTDDYMAYPTPMLMIVIVMMFIGGCAGSTAGGIKVERIVLMAKMSWKEFHESFRPAVVHVVRMGRSAVPNDILIDVSVFVGVFMASLAFGVGLVVITDDVSIPAAFGATLSCLSNMGPAPFHPGPGQLLRVLRDGEDLLRVRDAPRTARVLHDLRAPRTGLLATMSSGGDQREQGPWGAVRKLVIVLLLFGGMLLVHNFADRSGAFDPSAMLALGFVILASFAFGQLVGRLGLPHITGYIIAGLVLGPSFAHELPAALRIPPFEAGVLSESIILQLSPLETLAVALIALTAGGELRISSLRKGIATILSVLGGQLIFVVALCMAFMIAVSGVIEDIALPGLGELDLGGAAALGAVLGSVSIATSPAATIAVINNLRARGTMTSTVLATVVLKDVLVVVVFAVLSTLVAQAFGLGSETDQSLGLYLVKHIGGAVLFGAIVGGGMALYMRYVKKDVLLFLVGSVFVAAYLGDVFHLETVVLFLTAGFVTSNFSSEGETMLHNVEKLSLPVYVVFFTLTGAELHLDQLRAVGGFALAFVAIRALAIYLGTRLGAALSGAPAAMRTHGWKGFVSQAGVAITLGTEVGDKMGESGRALSTLIIAGIALNELIGPVLLKRGLTAAGESEASRAKADPESPEPTPQTEEAEGLTEWPAPERAADAWGPPLRTASEPLNQDLRELSLDLAHIADDIADAPLAQFREQALELIRELRREFLRHHRRITVQALDDTTELNASEALRLEQAELAEKWRVAVLARAARLTQSPGWQPAPILAAVEAVTVGLEEKRLAPYEPESFIARPGDGPILRTEKAWLRLRRGARRLFGEEMAPRLVELRALGRYHLWGSLPERLEPVAALHAQAEGHIVARTRSIFEGLVLSYDELAEDVDEAKRVALELERGDEPEGPPEPHQSSASFTMEQLEERLRSVRQGVEQELILAVQEVDRIAEDLALRTSLALGSALRELKADIPKIGTPELSIRRRAASRLYQRRHRAVEWLERGTAAARETSAGLYNRLALEMELHALEGRVKESLEEHATALGRDVHGRGHRQIERVHEALGTARARLDAALRAGRTTAELIDEIRTFTEPPIRIAAEAARLATALRDQLADESALTPVLDALARSARGLTDRYRIPAGPIARAEHRLPPPVDTVEVPFRDWVAARIETALAPALLASTREVTQKVEPLAHSLYELERRVAFNVELAINELSVEEDEHPPATTIGLVENLIGGAIERNTELFAGYAASSSTWGDEVRNAVRGAVLGSLDELRGSLVDGEVGRVRSQMVRQVRGQRIARYFSHLRGALRRSRKIVGRAVLEWIGKERIDGVRARLGVPAKLESLEIRDGTFDPPKPNASVPMVYRRLFSAQALEAADILTGRDDALHRSGELLDPKRDGLRTIAVVGPDGVGKSAFVHAIVRSGGWSRVRELALYAPATVEEVDALFEPTEGQLVVISGLRWLRAMTPAGLEPLRRFVQNVIADDGRNAFVVRADSLVWEQCLPIAPLAEAFSDVIQLGPLDPEALEAAVIARHTVSGHGLVFSHGSEPQSRLEELALRATSPLSRPRQSFFRRLHAASGGLLRDALRLWLVSVEVVDEAGDFVHLGPVPAPRIYALRHLDDDQVLTLYNVARQGWMSPEVCAALFRGDLSEARARLMTLRQLGILHRDKEVEMFRVAPHLRGSVSRLLEERGFLT